MPSDYQKIMAQLVARKCLDCDGTGKVDDHPCMKCKGKGLKYNELGRRPRPMENRFR
jgi:DnaJ-class molecular chaperone